MEKEECISCVCLGWSVEDGEEMAHCTCCCRRLSGGEESMKEEAALLISTDRLVAGERALETNDILFGSPLPELEEGELEMVQKGQMGNISNKIRSWVGEGTLPNKGESLSLDTEEISVLRHVSLFKINSQNIIFRLFVDSEGVVETLIFLEGESLIKTIWGVHEGLGHCAKRAVFEVLRKRYYGTNLR